MSDKAQDAIVVREEFTPVTVADMQSQAKRIEDAMRQAMKKDQDYGRIKGCGNKPTLLKPGAEKLLLLFQFAANIEILDIPTADGYTYRAICRLTRINDGIFVGAGIGEASTKETKFIRANPADVANTVLKMAKKRALIDAVLTATAASAVFTQDVEDPDFSPAPTSRTGTVSPARSFTTPPAPMSAPAPAPAPAPADEVAMPMQSGELAEGEVAIKVVAVTTKTGASAKGTWTRYSVRDGYGQFYSTFDSLTGKTATELQGQRAAIAFEQTDKGRNLLTIRPLPERIEEDVPF